MKAADRFHLGTMGFGYADWFGPFYPARPKLSGPQKLAVYAETFDAVELDSTFHATPPAERVATWSDAIPEHRRADFRFTAKLCKQVTHTDLSLVSDASRSAIAAHRDALEPIRQAGMLRAVLWQFPHTFKSSRANELLGAIDDWPVDWPLAVELRDDSWWQPGIGPELARVLRERNAAWVIADEPPKHLAGLPTDASEATDEYAPRSPIITGDWFYVRWIGQHEQFPDLAKERLDPTARLQWWADKLLDVLAGGRVTEIFGFFNNGYSGHSPAALRHMRRLLGLPYRPTPAERAEEQRKSELLFDH